MDAVAPLEEVGNRRIRRKHVLRDQQDFLAGDDDCLRAWSNTAGSMC